MFMLCEKVSSVFNIKRNVHQIIFLIKKDRSNNNEITTHLLMKI